MASRRTRVLTPLSRQVSDRASASLGALISSLPEKSLIPQERELLKAARAALAALAARDALGAFYDDGSTQGFDTDVLRQLAASSSAAAPGTAGAAAGTPAELPPPPADDPPPPGGGTGGGITGGGPFVG